MKKLIDVDDAGMTALLGQHVLVFCMNYIYYGILSGVNDSEILLDNAGIVFETGKFSDPTFKDFQPFGQSHYIRLSAVESYGITVKRP